MKIRLTFALLALVLVGSTLSWTLGPREPVDPAVRFDASAAGPALAQDPDAYLAREEANVPNLRPEAEKEIVWAYPESRARTPVSIVYVHGFSGSKDETRPLADEVAKAMGANLFFTRLTGHGQNGAAMAQASVNDWVNDLAEALAVGRAIGNEVVVMGQSTGGTLVAYGATLPALRDKMSAVVLLSPNFGAADPKAALLDLPWARDLLPHVEAAEIGLYPARSAEAPIWTERFPTTALLPMAALVRAARAADLASATLPALVVYSADDRLVRPAETRETMARWGGPHRLVEISGSGDERWRHLVAGDALSPRTTAGVAERIVYWLRSLPLQEDAPA